MQVSINRQVLQAEPQEKKKEDAEPVGREVRDTEFPVRKKILGDFEGEAVGKDQTCLECQPVSRPETEIGKSDEQKIAEGMIEFVPGQVESGCFPDIGQAQVKRGDDEEERGGSCESP